MKVKVNGRTLTYDALRIVFPRNVGIGFGSNIFWKGTEGFEPNTYRAIAAVAKSITNFVDIGSHFGWYSVIVQKINPNLKTYCYEPVSELVFHNKSFHKVNNCPSFTLVMKAVSDHDLDVSLTIPDVEPITEVRSSSVEFQFFYNKRFAVNQRVVACTFLDKEWLDFPLWNVGKMMIKIDVEGHEYSVIKGAKNLIRSLKPAIVCEIDFRSGDLVSLKELMDDLDYNVYSINPYGMFLMEVQNLKEFSGGNDFLLVPKMLTNLKYLSFDKLHGLFLAS